MSKSNLPKTILILTFLIAFTLIAGLFIYGYLETKKAKDFTVSSIEPVKNNQKIEPEEFPTEPAELETYEAELFIEAEWGDGEGEVGLFSMPLDFNPEEDVPENENLEGISYGPQSFDINDNNDHLFLLDSVNERVLEYDENGKYLKNFQIACGGTGDIRISPDYKLLYIWSNRCGAIYKYDIKGELLESYPVPKELESCWEGLGFDKDENIMCGKGSEEKRIAYDSFEAGRKYIFYQIEESGDKWKNNNYTGFPSSNGMEYYLMGGKVEDEEVIERNVLVLNKNGLLQRTFNLNLSRDGFVYFTGVDRDRNIYLEVQYSEGSGDIEIRKYNREGNLLALINIKPKPEKNYGHVDYFKYLRVSKKGDVYSMWTFIKEKEGAERIKIFKYSKVN